MTGKRTPSQKERRAVSTLIDALHTGSLRRSDVHGASDLLARNLPDASRLPQHALKHLAKIALRQASKAVPPTADEETIPSEVSRDELVQQPESQSVPKAAERLEIAANSNDLLPSVRPRTPSNPASAVRKRRRVSSKPLADEVGNGGSSKSFLVPRPVVRLDDVGGISGVLENIRELIEWPLVHSNVYEHLGVEPPRGILLHGPPGCGKTLLAHAIAGDFGVSFLRVSGPEIVSGMSGESERKLRDLFAEAVRLAPSIVFVDEVDAIASRREGASKDMERRIVSQLLTCIDTLASGTECRSSHSSEDGSSGEKREEANGDEQRETAQEIAGVNQQEDVQFVSKKTSHPVLVIAATNRPESLEPALRRAGRFDREIELGAPDEVARGAILSKLCRGLKVGGDFDVDVLAKQTAGYVGADLHLLAKEAGLACIRRFAKLQRTKQDRPDVDMLEAGTGSAANYSSLGSSAVERELFSSCRQFSTGDLDGCSIDMCDFLKALGTIQPSALREGFATRPDVSWENVGSLEAVREELMMAIVEPIRCPEMFRSLGLSAPAGLLLYGPPGCGKTLLARAVASESGANFISVKGPELLSKYVGDSELAVRKVFARARSSAPCVIFFDELDALAPRRGSGASESSGASERVVNMLLTEMDGFSERKQVFLVAATNRPDIIDPAMLRPGRLDKLVYVPLPDGPGRSGILRTLLRSVKIADDVDIDAIAADRRCEGFSGADLQAVIRTAGERALRERLKIRDSIMKTEAKIESRHFNQALEVVHPSVSGRDAKLYRRMEHLLRKTQGLLKETGENVE